MMIDNEIFGELEFDYAWYKKEHVLFGGKAEEIIILIAGDEDGEFEYGQYEALKTRLKTEQDCTQMRVNLQPWRSSIIRHNKGGQSVIYKVAICDDNETDARYAAQLLADWAKERGYTAAAKRFSSAESFLFHYSENKDYDILLLDIEMGSTDGVALAKKVRNEDESVQIVFITGYPDYIGEGYEVAALHYLMKPVNRGKLSEVLDRAVANLHKRERAVVLPVDGESVRIPVKEIRYVEAFSHSVSVVTAKGVYELRKSLAEMETMLGEGFVRCHRSYLVGLHFVAALSKTKVTLDNAVELPLSRSAAAMVHKAFVEFYSGGEHEAF